MNDVIDRFRGEYYFLSNFYEVNVKYEGITYSCSESAFQAQKIKDNDIGKIFSKLDAMRLKS